MIMRERTLNDLVFHSDDKGPAVCAVPNGAPPSCFDTHSPVLGETMAIHEQQPSPPGRLKH